MTKAAFLQAEIILCRSSITKSYMPAEVVIKLIFLRKVFSIFHAQC